MIMNLYYWQYLPLWKNIRNSAGIPGRIRNSGGIPGPFRGAAGIPDPDRNTGEIPVSGPE